MSETTEDQDGEEDVDSKGSESHSIIDHSVFLSPGKN